MMYPEMKSNSMTIVDRIFSAAIAVVNASDNYIKDRRESFTEDDLCRALIELKASINGDV